MNKNISEQAEGEKKAIIRNALIITMDENDTVKQGDIILKNNIIDKVAPTGTETDGESFAFEIDGRDCVVMPGLINTHGHAAMVLMRGYADDLPLMHWLEEKIWPLEAKLKPEDVYWGAMLSILEMLKSGTTTFTDMYFFMDEVAKAVEETGIRAFLSRGLIGTGSQSNIALTESKAFYQEWDGAANDRIRVMIGPHAPYTCPPNYLKKVIGLAEEINAPVQIHLAETVDELMRCQKDYGLSPVHLLQKTGLLKEKVLAAHCVHLSEEDIEILAENNVNVAHNPGSNLKLGSGIAPLPALLAKGITVGLGTDGAASNNNLDMLEEIRLAALLHKGYAKDPTLISASEALGLATRNGGKALFSEGQIGVIKEGYKADLIILDLNKPHLCPRHDLIAHIVYAAQPGDIKTVIIDGNIVVEEGRAVKIDETRVMHEAQKRALSLVM